MQYKNSTALIGVFTDLNQARKAFQVLEDEETGTSVRLIENDFSENLDAKQEDFLDREFDRKSVGGSEHKGGISGFFSRLFGFDEDGKGDKRELRINSDSELYFKDSYQKKQHFVVVDNPRDPLRCRDLLKSYGGAIEERGNELYARGRFENVDDAGDEVSVMELREEQMKVGKNRVQTGEVHLRKEIIEERRSIEVPLVREEIVIETRPLSGPARSGALNANDHGEIWIPVSEEQVTIEKTVVPREEIRVSKERITEQHVVSEDLRREEARIEEEGRVTMSAADRAKLKNKTGSNYKSEDWHP